MSYTGDPANVPTDRLRLMLGDTNLEMEGLSDAEYTYIMMEHTTDGVVDYNASYTKALGYLVAKYATYVTEKAGQLQVKYGEIFEHYKTLLNVAVKDPTSPYYSVGVYAPYGGGMYADEIQSNNANTNTVNTKQFSGWSTNDSSKY
jgi:hypothetical protein